jgi:hypothetical protein
MVESVLTEVPELSVVAGGWRPRITRWAHLSQQVYRAHPWLLAAVAMRRQAMGPHQLGWLDAAFAALDDTGLPAAQQHRIFVLVAGLVRTVAQEQQDFDQAQDEEWNSLTGELITRHAARFPHLTRAIAAGAFAPEPADPLEFALTRVLDGVQALIDRA